MDENLSKLKEQISKIEALKNIENWGPEYQLWDGVTEKLVRQIFGGEGLNLFKQQRTTVTSYIDEYFNRTQYLKELDNKKRIINGLLAGIKESTLKTNIEKTDKNILKEIWSKEEALKENLLKTDEAKILHDGLIVHLKDVLLPDSLPGLRFRKLQSGRSITWWSTNDGYPYPSAWSQFQPYLDLLSQHEAEKTIKARLETEGLFVESRSKGEDQHLLIGEKNGTGEKAHLIIDGKSGEIRIEDNQKEPIGIISKIETVLTLKSGKKIKTTREAVEEIL